MVQGNARADGHAHGNRNTSAPNGDSNSDSIVPGKGEGEGNGDGGNGNTQSPAAVASSPEVTRRQSQLLQSLRGDPQFCDAVLVVDTHEIPVHRAVLSQLSPFFRKILQQCASAGSGAGVPRITLQHASVVSTGVLVDYAYGLDVAKTCSKDIDTALDVANLAATLTISGLCDTAINAALKCASAQDYPRVYYAFKLFGRVKDAQKLLLCMARDGNLWKSHNNNNSNARVVARNNNSNNSIIDRMAPNDLLQLVVSPELTASEDDLFISLANWVSVDPQVRAQDFIQKFLPYIKAQRLTHKSHTYLLKLSRVPCIPPAMFANMLADSLAKPTAVPAGSDLGANVIVAPTHHTSSIIDSVLGTSLDWLNPHGRSEFLKCLTQQPIPRTYPVTTIHAQHYLLSVYDIFTTGTGKAGIGSRIGCHRDYYVDFVSLCMHFRVEINANHFLLHVQVERRNKMHPSTDNDNNNNAAQLPSLNDTLQPLAILCETTVAFLPGTPFESALGAWPAQQLAVQSNNINMVRAEAPPAKKRQRTSIVSGRGSMELVGCDTRRKKIIDTLQKEEENALCISVCLRTTKMSLLKNKGFLEEEKVQVAKDNVTVL